MGGVTVGTTPRDRIRRWFATLEFAQMRQLAVLAVLAATALFGGLDEVDDSVTTFEPGQEFDDGEFTVVVQRAALVDELRAGPRLLRPPAPGTRYLGVVATIRNDGTTPDGVRDEFDLRDRPGAVFVGAMRLAGGSPIISLGPGIREEAAFVWSVPRATVRPGQEIELRVWKKQEHELAVSYGRAWLDSETDYGRVRVRVGGSG